MASRKTYRSRINPETGYARDNYSAEEEYRPPGVPHPLDLMKKHLPKKPPTIRKDQA